MTSDTYTEEHSRNLVWLNEFDHDRMIALWHSGLIPMLTPASSLQQQRWTRILTLNTVSPLGHPTVLPKPVIVALDHATAPVAEFYAEVRGARPVVHTNSQDLKKFECPENHSILFFGLGRVFSPNTLASLTTEIRSPFGIVTARDQASLHFFAVKMALEAKCLGGGAGRSITAFDELEGVVLSSRREYPKGISERFSSTVLNKLVDGQGRAAIVLHVHGEGSHANLRSVVLCERISLVTVWPNPNGIAKELE
jgi:hypothetical protein